MFKLTQCRRSYYVGARNDEWNNDNGLLSMIVKDFLVNDIGETARRDIIEASRGIGGETPVRKKKRKNP